MLLPVRRTDAAAAATAADPAGGGERDIPLGVRHKFDFQYQSSKVYENLNCAQVKERTE